MTLIIKKILRWIFCWFILPLIFFYSAIWVFHPEEKLLDRLNRDLEEQAGILVECSEITIRPWGSIRLRDVVIKQTHDQKHVVDNQEYLLKKRIYFSGKDLSIQIAMRQLFYRKAALNFNGQAYSGEFEGSLVILIQKEVVPFEINGQWKNINLADLSVDYPNLQVKKGVCQGSMDFLMDQSQIFKIKGPATLNIEDTSLQTPANIDSSIDIPDFNRITAKLEFNYEELLIHEAWCYAPDTTVKISGMIYQKVPVRNSWLDLSLNIYLSGDKEKLKEDQYLPLKIKGPAKDPSIDFLGQDLRKMKR
ncbi:type II secretion system protein GspN [bacterium]|nr:type II secretion system protein GspN [bacterium]